jgi:predicted DNA-binding protein with PD1-like motif
MMPNSSSDIGTARFTKTPTGYLMVLLQGDNLFVQLEALMESEQIPSASFSAFGFARLATFGFFDFAKKQYDPRLFENVEMASITGSLAWQDGKPSIHAHGVGCDHTFAAVGGHLLALEVGTGSLEITITAHAQKLERKLDTKIGANVLDVRG